jgi:hypothetical protein
MVLRCPAGASDSYLTWSVRIGPVVHRIQFITGLKLPGREPDYLSPSNAEVIVWSNTSTTHMSWFHDAWLSTLTFSSSHFHCSFLGTTRLSTETFELNFARIELSFSVAGKCNRTWCNFSLLTLPFIGRMIKTSRFIELEGLPYKITPFCLILNHFNSLYFYAIFIQVT